MCWKRGRQVKSIKRQTFVPRKLAANLQDGVIAEDAAGV
jgi:hypothetical protein